MGWAKIAASIEESMINAKMISIEIFFLIDDTWHDKDSWSTFSWINGESSEELRIGEDVWLVITWSKGWIRIHVGDSLIYESESKFIDVF